MMLCYDIDRRDGAVSLVLQSRSAMEKEEAAEEMCLLA